MTFDSTAREIESMPTDTKAAASTLLSLDGQRVAPEISKGTDATAVGDGNVRGFQSSDIKTMQAVENTCFATQLLGMHLNRIRETINNVPGNVV